MNARLGNILYRAGLAGAAMGVFYAVNVIWAHHTGQALVSLSKHYVSREEMLAGVSTGVVAALLCWGAGVGTRYLLSRPAKEPNTEE